MGKLTRPQIWIIFGVLSLIAGLTLFFTLNQPRRDDIDREEKRRSDRQQIADQKMMADKELKDAKALVVKANADWAVFDRRFMPRINLNNLYHAWEQLQDERLRVLGQKLDKFIRADKSVQIVQASFSIPAPPDDPNQTLSPIFTYSGSVTVSGNFDAILKHVERWNTLDRLALVTGFTLQGNSPQLVGSYSVQIFEFTQGGDKLGPTFPAAGGGAGGGGGFPGGGGAPPMMGGGGAPPMSMPGGGGAPTMSMPSGGKTGGGGAPTD